MSVCPACYTGRLQRRQIPYLEWHGKNLLVVNRMPAIVCDVCGERMYDPDALEHLQRLVWSTPLRSQATPMSGRSS
jgi:YgiT-type zinc finger domain-containing protein